MFLWLILMFTVLPAVELTLLIQVGRVIGLLPTLAVVLSTGVAGAWLARQEGMRTMRKVQDQLARGQMPGDELMDGFLILFAGAVLLTPGFVTDLWGLLILFPPTRAIFKAAIKHRLEQHVVLYQQQGGDPFGMRPDRGAPFQVIDVTELDDDEDDEDRVLH